MSKIKLKLPYKPFPHQIKFHKCKAPLKGLGGGNKTGKTLALIVEVIRYCIKNPGKTVWFIIRDIHLGSQAMDYFYSYCPDVYKENKRLRKITFTHHLKLGKPPTVMYWVVGEKPFKIESGACDLIAIDEATLMKPTVFEKALLRMKAGQRVKVYITGTPDEGYPEGTFWVYKYFINPSTKFPEAVFINASAYDNPLVDREYLKELERKLDETKVRQKIYGEWIFSSNIVFIEFKAEEHIIEYDGYIEDDFGNRYDIQNSEVVLGIDFGYGPENPFVVEFLARWEDGTWIVFDEIYVKRRSLSEIASMIYEKISKWGIQKNLKYIFPDPASAFYKINKMEKEDAQRNFIYLEKFLKNYGIDVPFSLATTSFESNRQIISHLFKSEKLFISDRCPKLIEELKIYRYGDKHHDHSPKALMYAIGTYEELKGNAEKIIFEAKQEELEVPRVLTFEQKLKLIQEHSRQLENVFSSSKILRPKWK